MTFLLCECKCDKENALKMACFYDNDKVHLLRFACRNYDRRNDSKSIISYNLGSIEKKG